MLLKQQVIQIDLIQQLMPYNFHSQNLSYTQRLLLQLLHIIETCSRYEFFGYQFIRIYNNKIYFVRILFIFFLLFCPRRQNRQA